MTKEQLEEFDDPDFDPDFKSKTQLKQEMHELRKLGLEIAELPLTVLETIELSAELRAAINDYRRIGHKNALKRQASFIGKLMRHADADAIRAQMDALHESRHKATRQLHLVEQWRDRLLDGSNESPQAFFDTYPSADRQQIRSLIRVAIKEKQTNKPPTSARKLFKLIQAMLSEDNN